MPAFIGPQPARFGILGTQRANKESTLFDYSKYEAVLKFITSEMNKNSKGDAIKSIKELNEQVEGLERLAKKASNEASRKVLKAQAFELFALANFKFLLLVGPRAEWDFKNKGFFQKMAIKVKKRGGGEEFVTPIRGDNRYVYTIDIWGNIHYSVVGLAAGFSAEHLLGANDLVAGIEIIASTILGNPAEEIIGEADDRISVELGLKLGASGSSTSKGQLHSGIFSIRRFWSLNSVRLDPRNLKIEKN